uniref:Uncharacterized protein n=1 Tax=Anabas testudineus TaxID=64144 RepID=A0A3Q1JEC4_ANATE
MVAQEHLKELDKQLQEEAVPFAPEVCLHLTEIAAAIAELEADRRAAHELLEVETIENSKLRHQINNIRERMSQEIMADVEAARASNAEQIDQLQKELNVMSQLQESTVKSQEAILSKKEALYHEREQAQAEHDGIVATLNGEITLKYSSQMRLDHTREQIEELKSCIAAAEQDKITLKRKIQLEREDFNMKKDNLSRDVHQTEANIKQQKEAIKMNRKELARVNSKKHEIQEHLGELTAEMAKQESSVQRLTASRKSELELSIQGLKEETSALLQPKKEAKAELEALRASHMDMLNKQASELRAVEISIYDNSVKLEQVSMENSRLHLCIRQMTEDVNRTRQNKDRYQQEIHKFTEHIKTLCESLQEAWGEDLLVTQDYQRSNNVVLMSLSDLLNHLETRRQQLGHVNSLLHQQMLDFSKRLGDKTTVGPHS